MLDGVQSATGKFDCAQQLLRALANCVAVGHINYRNFRVLNLIISCKYYGPGTHSIRSISGQLLTVAGVFRRMKCFWRSHKRLRKICCQPEICVCVCVCVCNMRWLGLWSYVRKVPSSILLLGAFAELRKATASFVVCPSARMEQLGSHWTDFYI